MSTSKPAREGLGWPVQGAGDDGGATGLGWPPARDGSIFASSSAATSNPVSVASSEACAGLVAGPILDTDPSDLVPSVSLPTALAPAAVPAVDVPRAAASASLPALTSDLGLNDSPDLIPNVVSDLPDVGVPDRVFPNVSVVALEAVAKPGPTTGPESRVEQLVQPMGEPAVDSIPDAGLESVADSGVGSVPESVHEPRLGLDEDQRLRSVTDPTRVMERTDLPTGDAVSRETVGQSGVEQLSERDQLAASLPVPGSETPLAQAVAKDARRRISLSDKVFPKPDHTRVLTVANQKGGVGKTTTTVNIAAALAQAGLRVLVVDIDPQGNASTALGIDHHADVPSIYDVLVDERPVLDCVQECADIPNLWCIPATIDLAGAEIELVSLVARETRMEKALSLYIAGAAGRGEERFDYVLIDCPPSLGLLTVNAFVAADEVFIPIQCEYYALEGLSQLLKNIELIKSHLNPGLHVSTILLTMYDGRTRLSAQVAEEVRSHFPAQVLQTAVPRSVRISEAPSFGQTVMTYDPSSSGALSYLEAASELAERGVAAKRGASGQHMAGSVGPKENS